MLVATSSFLSALILSRRIERSSTGGLGSAARAASPSSSSAPASAEIVVLARSILMALRLLRMDAGDLGAPDADAAHQTLLVEDEGVHALLDRRGREVLAESLVEDDQAGPRPQLEAFGLVEVGERVLVHEEEHVAKGLGSGLEPVGGGQRAVVCDGLSSLAQRAVSEFTSDDEAALHDAREDQHRDRLGRE